MMPLEMLLRQKEIQAAAMENGKKKVVAPIVSAAVMANEEKKVVLPIVSAAAMANEEKKVVAPVVSASAMANEEKEVVAPVVSQITPVKGPKVMTNDEEEYIPETPPPEREDSTYMANGLVTTPSKAEDMSAFWNNNVRKELIKSGFYNRGGPRITNRATSRGRMLGRPSPNSSMGKVDPRARSQSRKRGTFTGREYDELRRQQLENRQMKNPYGYRAGGGERPKTKKRTLLKHKRTRRKERK